MPNFARRGSRQSIEPKAVLEHRAPKTSPPILHSRSAESKAGRAVRCAPVWVVLTRLLGWNPGVRALTGAATARATLWVVKSACYALPTLTALRPRWPRAKSAQRGGESAGRAVHCAPVWVVLTRLLGRNPGVPAHKGAATSYWSVKFCCRFSRGTPNLRALRARCVFMPGVGSDL